MSLTEAVVRPVEHGSSLWGRLSEDEQAQLRRWNDTVAEFPQSLHARAVRTTSSPRSRWQLRSRLEELTSPTAN